MPKGAPKQHTTWKIGKHGKGSEGEGYPDGKSPIHVTQPLPRLVARLSFVLQHLDP